MGSFREVRKRYGTWRLLIHLWIITCRWLVRLSGEDKFAMFAIVMIAQFAILFRATFHLVLILEILFVLCCLLAGLVIGWVRRDV
ncbi:MAG TPA: hypothetical protein VKR06_26470 [Ktedonosporobacter sp.]|nr:hypothetical protein [Ktedonosporobacter sp.]